MKKNKRIEIIRSMLNNGNSVVKIANSLETSPQLIYWYMKKYDIEKEKFDKI